MAGQIFERKGWAKAHNIRLVLRLNKLKLDPSIRSVFRHFDKKDLLIKNFIYLVRLNDFESKNYVDYFLLMELVFCNNFMCFSKINSEKYAMKIISTINRLNNIVQTPKYEFNYEEVVFKPVVNRLKDTEAPYLSHHQMYNRIAQIYYQPFANMPNGKLYYSYGYLLTMLLTMLTYNRIFDQNTNVNLFIVKLNILNMYNKIISEITPFYFNDFIKQNNYYLKNYK